MASAKSRKTSQKRTKRVTIDDLLEEVEFRKDASAEDVSNSQRSRSRRLRVNGGTPDAEVAQSPTKKRLFDELWTDSYAPSAVGSLVVRAPKVREIENALVSTTNCAVLITGPPGCGKTTTLRLLCKSLNINLIAWDDMSKGPNLDVASSSERSPIISQSLHMQLSEHLRQCSRMAPLATVSRGTSVLKPAAPSAPTRHILLFDEWTHSASRQPLLDLIQQYLEQYRVGQPKIVILITDDLSDEISSRSSFRQSSSSSLTISRLSSIPRVAHIKMNAIAAATMTKALRQVWVAKKGGTPPTSILDRVVERSNGDLNQAITELQLEALAYDGQLALRMRLSPEYECPLLQSSQLLGDDRRNSDALEMSEEHMHQSKDTRFDLPHRIAKVLYAKRSPSSGKLECDVEKLYESHYGESGKTERFIGAVHENFLDHVSDLDAAADILESWSNADTMRVMHVQPALEPQFDRLRMSISCRAHMFHRDPNAKTQKRFQPVRIRTPADHPDRAAWRNACLAFDGCRDPEILFWMHRMYGLLPEYVRLRAFSDETAQRSTQETALTTLFQRWSISTPTAPSNRGALQPVPLSGSTASGNTQHVVDDGGDDFDPFFDDGLDDAFLEVDIEERPDDISETSDFGF